MNLAAFLALLSIRTELADQLVGETIARVGHRQGVQLGGPTPIVVLIDDGEGTLIVCRVLVDIETPTAARQTFRNFEEGLMEWERRGDDGAITVAGVVNGHDRVRIVVMPAGDRLQITFCGTA